MASSKKKIKIESSCYFGDAWEEKEEENEAKSKNFQNFCLCAWIQFEKVSRKCEYSRKASFIQNRFCFIVIIHKGIIH